MQQGYMLGVLIFADLSLGGGLDAAHPKKIKMKIKIKKYSPEGC
jgi:hypothetical protein